MAELKLYVLKNKPFLEKYKFIKTRDCGDGDNALALAVLIGYLDNLIIAQDSIYSNHQFVDKV